MWQPRLIGGAEVVVKPVEGGADDVVARGNVARLKEDVALVS